VTDGRMIWVDIGWATAQETPSGSMSGPPQPEAGRTGTVRDYFRRGDGGDTRGTAPGSKWCAANAIEEYAHYGRRYTRRSYQVRRSFEDTQLKQHGFQLLLEAQLDWADLLPARRGEWRS
jgi:hypothetical protein